MINYTFAQEATTFFNSLNVPERIKEVDILNPYHQDKVKSVVAQFCMRYYNDSNKRTFIVGINPGRLGGGVTGIAFTDPVTLRQYCGIENDLGDKRELSSRFIYSMIEAFGGPAQFYAQFYLTAIFPLALVKDNKNFNYYDEPSLFEELKPLIVSSIESQLKFGADRKRAVCLGKKNHYFLEKLNKEFGFFETIQVLEHPRYIMQYKSKEVPEYISHYHKVLEGN